MSAARDERRQFARRVIESEAATTVQVMIRPGRDVRLVDLSLGGALVHTASRLLPGSLADLQVRVDGWQWTGTGRVVRCQVWLLILDQQVRYRAAIQFVRPMDPADHARISGSPLAEGPAGGRGYSVPATGSMHPR